MSVSSKQPNHFVQSHKPYTLNSKPSYGKVDRNHAKDVQEAVEKLPRRKSAPGVALLGLRV